MKPSLNFKKLENWLEADIRFQPVELDYMDMVHF